MLSEIFESHILINYFIIPGLICLARICDVSLGTIRIISISKGMKSLAAGLGFFRNPDLALCHWTNYAKPDKRCKLYSVCHRLLHR